MAKLGESGVLCKCSFCGRSQEQVQKLIAGPGVYICESCVGLCCEILQEEGLTNPWRRDPHAATFLREWIDGFDTHETERVREAKRLLDELSSQLAGLLERGT